MFGMKSLLLGCCLLLVGREFITSAVCLSSGVGLLGVYFLERGEKGSTFVAKMSLSSRSVCVYVSERRVWEEVGMRKKEEGDNKMVERFDSHGAKEELKTEN